MGGRLGPYIISSDDTTATAILVPSTVTALNGYAVASGPVTAGAIWRATDDKRGLWMGNGSVPSKVYPHVHILDFAGADPTGATASDAAFAAAMTALSGGGTLDIGSGNVFAFADTLTWEDGVRIVGGGFSVLGTGSALDFSAMSGSDPAILFNDVNNGGLEHLRVIGRTAGSTGPCVLFTGTNRHLKFDGVLVSDASSDGGCFGWDHSAGGYSTLCRFIDVRTANAAYGFYCNPDVGGMAAPVFINSFANGHSITGFHGRIDQASFVGCYAERNGAYGWNLINGWGSSLMSCNIEYCPSGAVRLENNFNTTINTLFVTGCGSAGNPSCITFGDSVVGCTISGIGELAAGVGATESIGGVTPASSAFFNNYLQLPYSATTKELPRIQDNSIYIGGAAHYYSASQPTVGTWGLGDIAWNIRPDLQNVPGWICVAAGTPGTWRRMPYALLATDPYTYWGTNPTLGVATWHEGDVVYNNHPTVGQPIGWQCTAGGTPGTWGTMPNLA